MNKYKLFNIALGPLLMVLCITLLPSSLFHTLEMRASIGTIAWMSVWWVTSCTDYAVTAFLPIAINSIISIAPMSSVISNYASETILLLLGASILTVSWEIVHLDKRIAYTFLIAIGSSLSLQIIFWFTLSTLMSTVLPNSIVCATITPIAISMLKYVGITDIGKSSIGAIILMSIAWGAGLGGLASPLGGAMNLVVVDYIESITSTEFMYIDWVIRFAPIVLVIALSNILFLLIIKPKGTALSGSKDYFIEKKKELGKLTRNELSCLALFLIATIASFSRSLFSHLLPSLTPAYIFIICAILSFFIYNSDGTPIMIWKNVQTKIVWDLIYVFAGGLAVGTLINSSGAADALGNLFSFMSSSNELLLIFIVLAFTTLLSDLTSNTATAAIALPIVLNATLILNLNPFTYIFTAAIGVNLAYCLPTSIRAIPVGYGLNPKYMLKHGAVLTSFLMVFLTLAIWTIINLFPAFFIL